MAYFPTDFNVLITTTLAQVLDMLCFYLIKVESPPSSSCYGSGTPFVIRGYNFFSLGNPKCRWQQVGTGNYLYTAATVNSTNITVPPDIGTIGLISCPAPTVTTDPFNAILEISRDGYYYTNNGLSVLLRNDCSAPIPPRVCPDSTVTSLFATCTPQDFTSNSCASACLNISNSIGFTFADQGTYIPAFNSSQIRDCLTKGYPTNPSWTPAILSTIISRSGPGVGPCQTPAPTANPTPDATGGAACLSVFSTLCLVAVFSV